MHTDSSSAVPWRDRSHRCSLCGALLSRPSLERLTALVRAPSDAATLPAILNRVNPARDMAKLRVIIGDVTHAGLGLTQQIGRRPITSVIHGAAFTKFRDSGGQWEQVNVTGHRETNCPDAPPDLSSTLCPAGKTIGSIPEAPLEKPEGFVNGYEASKWHSEQLVQEARGAVAIVRLATVVGSQSDGSLRRVGRLSTMFFAGSTEDCFRWSQAICTLGLS